MDTPPRRHILPHAIPSWVEPGALYFVTLCARPKDLNQLCHPVVGKAVLDTARFYHEHEKWWLRLMVLMPDHVHAVLAFPRGISMKKTLPAWKGFVAKTHGIEWQRDFFDHRLRNDESLDEKLLYVRQNPVRRGFVEKASDWPYVLECG